jgi:hypothetical protein
MSKFKQKHFFIESLSFLAHLNLNLNLNSTSIYAKVEKSTKANTKVGFFCSICSNIYVSHSSIIQEWLVLTQETNKALIQYIYADHALSFYESPFSSAAVIGNVKLVLKLPKGT